MLYITAYTTCENVMKALITIISIALTDMCNTQQCIHVYLNQYFHVDIVHIVNNVRVMYVCQIVISACN